MTHWSIGTAGTWDWVAGEGTSAAQIETELISKEIRSKKQQRLMLGARNLIGLLNLLHRVDLMHTVMQEFGVPSVVQQKGVLLEFHLTLFFPSKIIQRYT